jgi:hypothetical protein
MAGMKSMKSLSFRKTVVTQDVVKAVANFPNLMRLNIDYSWRDASLVPLHSLKNLETLELDDLPITDERIAFLKSLPNLREVDFDGSDAIPQADIANLRKLLPNVKVTCGAMR